MREGWELKTLNELFDVKSSKRVHKADWKDSGVPFYRAREVVILAQNGSVDNALFISEELYNEFTKEKGAPKVGDIIISAVGTLGQCYLVKSGDKFYFKDASVLWFENISNVNSRYIEYAFKSDLVMKQVMHKSMGATVGTLTISRAKIIEIPIPPLPEQQQIVALLDQAFEAIDQAKANIEKNIENAKELFQSKLNNIFSQKGEGWEKKTLGSICENLDSKRVPITKSKRIAGDIPYYGASGIVDYVADYLFDEDLLLVSEDGANLLARTYPIAFSISGKNWVNNHAHVLRFDNMISQKFIEFYLNSIKLDDYVSGMAQPKLNQRMLNSIPVPFPPIKGQEKVLEVISVLNRDIKSLCVQYSQKLEALEELKKSILQKAFAGELTNKVVEV